jgi:hypothetical protein
MGGGGVCPTSDGKAWSIVIDREENVIGNNKLTSAGSGLKFLVRIVKFEPWFRGCSADGEDDHETDES